MEIKRKKKPATKQIGTRVQLDEVKRLEEYADTYNGEMAMLIRMALDEFVKNHPLKYG